MQRAQPFLALGLGLVLGGLTLALGWKVIALIGAIAAIIVLAVRPLWCLYLLIATIPLAVDYGGGITLTRVLVPTCVMLVCLNACVGRCPWPHPFCWPFGAMLTLFFGVAIASVMWARDRSLALQELGPYALLVVMVLLTLAFVRDRHDLERAFWVVTWVAVVQGLIALAQIHLRFVLPGDWRPLAQANIDITEAGFRAEGTTPHPIVLAGFLQMALPFAVLLLFRTRHHVLRLVLIASVPLLLYAWKSTYSRSSAIAMVVMLLALLAISSRWGRMLAAGLVTIAFVVLAAHGMSIEAVLHSIEAIELFGSAFHYADLYGSVESFQFRIESWVGGFRLFLANPVLGVGLAQAKDLYVPFLPAWAVSPVHPVVIHNAFIEVASELGILGFAAFAGLLIHAFACLIRNWSDPELGGFARALFVTLLGQVVLLMFTPMIREIWLTLPLAAALGRIGHVRRSQAGDPLNTAYLKPTRHRVAPAASHPSWVR